MPRFRFFAASAIFAEARQPALCFMLAAIAELSEALPLSSRQPSFGSQAAASQPAAMPPLPADYISPAMLKRQHAASS
jgi:hypothetical protein